LAKFGDLYLNLGKEIAKIRRENVSNFTLEQYALCAIYLTIPHFLKFFVRRPPSKKLKNLIGSLLGIGPRNFAEIWTPLTSNRKKIWHPISKIGGDIRGAPKIVYSKISQKLGGRPLNFVHHLKVHLNICWHAKLFENLNSRFSQFLVKFWRILGPRHSLMPTVGYLKFCRF